MEFHNTNAAAFQHPTLVDLLRYRAVRQSQKLAYIFLPDGEEDEQRITYGQLDRRARAIAAWLQDLGAEGERALLLYPAGLDFIAVYFGCLYAGVTAVPVYPPRLNRPSPRIQGIVADAQARFALTTTQILEKLERRFEHMPDLAALHWLNTDTLPAGLDEQWRDPGVTPDTLAFLQYTSGSTSAPKGVMVSHGNLMHNLEMIRRGFRIDHRGSGVFWLPSYHDMGLIGGILEPMYINGPSVLMDPAAFLQRPVRWLRALSRYKGTISGAPNFAYQMCVDKVTPDQCEGLDLSQWEIAFSGAEPIRPETLRAFARRFGPYGFSSDAFYPCYGLAEGTLLAAGGDGAANPIPLTISAAGLTQNRAVVVEPDVAGAQTMVSSGHALLDQRIVIVDPHTLAPCAPDEVGEIWIAGDSVAQGYWNRPQATRETFAAFIAGSDEGPFLRSGDLGFLHQGELYITGRFKDLIIIRGRNHYPQDIEQTVDQCHEAFETGMGAAFSIDVDGEEQLVVTYELKRRHRRADVHEVAAAARRAIAAQHGLQAHAIVLLKPLSIPRTSSGKIKRHACRQGFLDGTLDVVGQWQADDSQQPPPAGGKHALNNAQPAAAGDAPPAASGPQQTAIENWLIQQIAAQLRIAPQQISLDRPFVDFGLDSVQAVSLTGELEAWLERSLPATLVWDYPTIRDLAAHLAPSSQSPIPRSPTFESPVFQSPVSQSPIALISLSCRFPGAPTPEAFWRLLHEGVDAISEVPADRWDVEAYYDADGEGAAPGKMNTRWGGFLTGVDQFDPHFFGISPREAERMDPQQRLLLEIAWEALERAGKPPSQLAGSRTGVFVGISGYDYSRLQMSDAQRIDAYAGTGNAHSVAANRLSYIFDFRGPSVAVDTACSSSLVSVHLALQSLRSGESDMALAGGVNLLLRPELTITFSQARMMAADGRCKTFDAAADGYVRGEGAGIVVLKRLDDALRDGDPVLAVLYGSAVNQDGRSNGLTAPNGHAQQAVIRQALQNAGVEAADLDYVEAHGTGTPLGDPIEVQSLRAVLEEDAAGPERCFLGSVKTNIGHLEAAAGIAGLVKVVLALQHGEIPAHLHFNELNPYISLDGSPLSIAARPQPWPSGDRPRLAGVSSFGFGGTNAHVVLGDAKIKAAERSLTATPDNVQSPLLLPLSAKNEPALLELVSRYADFIEAREDVSLAAICQSAAAGRDHFAHRLALVAPDRENMLQQLRQFHAGAMPDARSITSSLQTPENSSIAFLFTGQGSQYPGMARRLYETQPVFRAALDRCAEILRDYIEEPLLDVIFAGGQEAGESRIETESNDAPIASLLHDTAYTQPALFAVEYALAELWSSWGVKADVLMGHSVGEYVAACVAGVFSLQDGLRLIAARGRLMQSLPQNGSMAVIFASRQRVQTALARYGARVAIAAVNGAESITISGETAAIEAILSALSAEEVESRSLTVSHAFHSPLMDPMLDAFELEARAVAYQAPHTTLISNVTGQPFAGGEVPDAAYWRQHVRRPVEFAAGVQALLDHGANVFLEIGPQPHLLSMAQRILEESTRPPGPIFLPSLRRNHDGPHTILQALAALYQAGLEIDWSAFYDHAPRAAAPLPTYPFQRQRYWMDFEVASWALPESPATHSGGLRRLPTALPLYEGVLQADNDDMLQLTIHDLLRAAAADYWGDGQHQVLNLLLDRADLLSEHATLQLAFQTQKDDLASVQLFRHDGQHARWLLCGSAQLQRGVSLMIAPRFAGERSNSPVVDGKSRSLRQRLLALDEEERTQTTAQFLQQQIAEVLGLAVLDMPLKQPLDALGLDSLMAIELRNRIEAHLQLTVPVVNFLRGPSIENLSAQLLELLNETDGERRAITCVDNDRQSPAPLSYGQQAMWFLNQLLPEDIAFNVAGAVRLHGDLDVIALRSALQTVVERHPSLRMTYSMHQGLPVQKLGRLQRLPLQEVDARTWSEHRIQSYLEREAHSPFDLQYGPLLRLALLQRDLQEHILLLSISHIATDFWSMSLLVQEITLAYQAFSNGQSPQLPPLSLDYVDYVHWQRQTLSGEEGQRLREYWLRQLGGELPLLDLPTDRPRPAQQTFRGDTTSRRFSPNLARALHRLAQEHGATLATTLLAAFQALLHRYSGQEDIVVGSVLSGRERPELSPLVGYFINPVALRADFSGAPTFAAFLRQARQTMLDAFTHQDYPLALLAEQLTLQRDPGRPPIFETMFIMQQAQLFADQGLSALALGLPGANMDLGDLSVESLTLGGLPAQFDLTLMMAEVPDGLAAALHYNTALFDSETAARMLLHLERLLQGVIADPQQPLARIPLLSPGEERLLLDWNETAAVYPHMQSLPRLFEEQAGRAPGPIAATGAGESLTYGTLNRHANQLAYHLRELGVGPGTLVGVALERTPQLPVALLGVLKAGGAYVPLDPAFPAARLALMIEDAQPAVILSQQSLLESLPLAGAKIVCLDRDWSTITTAPQGNLEVQIAPDDLAYVIYTSGSTGRPKGVQIAHRAAVNFLCSMQRQPGLGADDVLLAVTTLSFDIALLELFLPLLSGARVVIATAEEAADGLQLLDLLQSSGATVMQATPATWRMLLASGWEGNSDLKILCGGEALPRDLADALLARSAELWNMYGPTETTVWSTTCRVQPGQGAVPIGRPIANTQIYILDDAGQPVPIGVAGELYIGGDGVAHGYLNRPDLTSQKFISESDPQLPISSLPLYRTGDLARFDARGHLYFLGRRDQQVKVRGFRIELGDVETALGAHPRLQQAVVVAYGRGAERSLVAYFVAQDGATAPPAAELRQFLRQSLPDYMIPSAFIALDALPLTPNNKVDRRALPAPPDARPVAGAPFAPPRTPLEKELAHMCAAILNLAPDAAVGLHDDFFDLGGTSLLATRLIFQVREQFQVQIPLRQLFAEPTVAGLARALESGPSSEPDAWHMTVEQLNAEVQLDPQIDAGNRTYEPPAELRNVLLTGATGFLGAFLLRDLLQETEATVHCLVRSAGVEIGLQRLRRNLQTYELWDETFAERIVVLPGDLAEPRLGLDEELFHSLAHEMDAIIHNGALVNFVYPYAAHKPANVLGTAEVLRMAALDRLQAVHFVSTLSVFHTGAHDDGTVFTEDDDLDTVGGPFGGYAQSKWVAEKLLLEAGRRGLPTAIYRPGLVSGAAETGAWNTTDMMTTLARASLAMGLAPDLDEGEKETQIDVVPVDYVSAAIVHLAQQGHAVGKIFHLNNPEPLPYRRLLDLAGSLGVELQPVPFAEWRSRLTALAMQAGGNGAASFLPLLEEVTVEQVFMPAFDCHNTLQGLEESAIVCPPVGPRLLYTYLSYFQRKGMLPDPEAGELQPLQRANGEHRARPMGDRRHT